MDCYTVFGLFGPIPILSAIFGGKVIERSIKHQPSSGKDEGGPAIATLSFSQWQHICLDVGNWGIGTFAEFIAVWNPIWTTPLFPYFPP